MDDLSKLAISYTKKPSRATVNSLKALCKLAPPDGQEGSWGVYSYVLNRDICKEDGHPDNLYGLFILLGVFPNQSRAEKRAEFITQSTGSRTCAVQLCRWTELREVPDSEHTTVIKQDANGKLVEFENQEFKKQQESYAKKYEEEQSILQEQEKELDPDDISYYKQQWLLTLQNYARLRMAEKKLEATKKSYEKRVQKIQEHYRCHPEHDREWLNYLSEIDYTDSQIECIRSGYEDLRVDILGDISVDDDKEGEGHSIAESLPEIPSTFTKITSSENSSISSDSGEIKEDREWKRVSKNKRRKARRYKNSQ